MKGSRIAGLIAIAVSAIPGAALATTLNFAGLAAAGNSWNAVGATYTLDGFTVATLYGLDAWGTSSPNLPGLASANTSLFAFYAGDSVSVTEGGTAFSVNSIDLAPVLAGGQGTFDVTFIGTLFGSGTVSQTCTVTDGTPTALQTCDLSGFNNLVSLQFAQGTNGGFYESQISAYQFDNIVLNGSSGPSVPEPGTLGLLGLGLAGAAFARRKRTS